MSAAENARSSWFESAPTAANTATPRKASARTYASPRSNPGPATATSVSAEAARSSGGLALRLPRPASLAAALLRRIHAVAQRGHQVDGRLGLLLLRDIDGLALLLRLDDLDERVAVGVAERLGL